LEPGTSGASVEGFGELSNPVQLTGRRGILDEGDHPDCGRLTTTAEHVILLMNKSLEDGGGADASACSSSR
jgi:hypothetical protein